MESRIARVGALLRTHLMEAFVAPDWTGPAPAIVDAPMPGGTGERGDALLAVLYHLGHNAARRARELPALGASAARLRPALAVDLDFLIVAHAAEPARAQALLECACRRLHASPAIPESVAGPAMPLVFEPLPVPPETLFALRGALGLPLRPALAYRATVLLDGGAAAPAPAPVTRIGR